jgi:glycosyltransferase involved in cell wall biosynthesis
MSSRDIQVVGNCVDNEFFSRRAEEVRRAANEFGLPRNFFVFVGRFIPEKNLLGLIEGFRLYRQAAGANAWDLVLVGAGPQEEALRKQVAAGAVPGVVFAGPRQLEDLPRYYGRAKCLVLPSSSEPWGLVVNEAMASSLPVIVSTRCGCAVELVRDGANGFVFEPTDVRQLAALLRKVSSGLAPLEAMGAVGRTMVAAFSPSLFAQRSLKHLQRLSEERARERSTAGGGRWPIRLARSRGEIVAAAWACLS